MGMTNSLLMSLAAGSFVGGASGYLGSLMITRKMALVGDALGHVALPGMGLALLLHLDSSVGAFVFLTLGILVIWRLGERTSLSLETLAGLVFVTSLALGFLIIPKPELLEGLIGDLSQLTAEGTGIAALISVVVIVVVKKIYPGMTLLSISPDLATVEGIPVSKYNFAYLCAVALIVSVGIRVAGSLLVGALVIVPAATARVLSSNLKFYRRASFGFGVVSAVLGILSARLFNLAPGPTIILMSSILFIFAVMSKR